MKDNIVRLSQTFVRERMSLPEEYRILDDAPDDPYGCVTYGKNTPQALCMVQAYPIEPAEALEPNSLPHLIAGIHQSLADNQALIEVDNGSSRTGGRPYIYSIVKTNLEAEGVQYSLMLQMHYDDKILNIQGYFTETGVVGIRDTTVYSMLEKEGLVCGNDDKRWKFDPYDPQFDHPYKMNLGEKRQFDEAFPLHPLSQCRELLHHMKENM